MRAHEGMFLFIHSTKGPNVKNVLQKLKLTETALEPNIIPQWKDDPEFFRWTAKCQEIIQRSAEAEIQQRLIQEQIQEAEAAIVKTKSEIILEEGSPEELKAAEANLATLLQTEVSLTLELKALAAATDRAEREASHAEIAAKETAIAIVLPIYQERVRATLEHLEAAMAANEETKTFEKLVGQSGLSLHHSTFGSPYVINGINFPLGLKEYRQNVEGLLNKTKL